MTLNIPLDHVEVLVSLLNLNVGSSNLRAEVNVLTLRILDMLPQIVTVGADAVDVLSEGACLEGLCIVKILKPCNFSLGVIELLLSASDFEGPGLDNLLGLAISY